MKIDPIDLACDADHWLAHENHLGEQTARSMYDIQPWGTIELRANGGTF